LEDEKQKNILRYLEPKARKKARKILAYLPNITV